ncbi:MAG: glycosyltransferase [Coriobacteriia bacterium]|nr:glycosyltransferase [Coriobacteriia bacterium]
MKVLIVGPARLTALEQWVSEMKTRGYEVLVVSPDAPRPALRDVTVTSEASSIPYLRFVARILRLRRLIREFRPDLLHAHGALNNALWAALAGFHPLLVTCWGSDVLVAPASSRLMRWKVVYALRRADYVTATSRSALRAARELAGRQLPGEVISWGADLEVYDGGRRDRRRGESGEVWLVSSRMHEPLYNVDAILRAFAHALAEEPRLRLHVAGRGSQTEALTHLADELGVSDHVTFHGFLDQPVLADLYAASDIYVSVPSSDASAVSNLEAMAAGMAAVLSDLPSVREWVEDGVDGVLVPAGNEARIAEALLTLAGGRRERERLGRRAREIVVARGDRAKQMDRADEVYRELSGCRSRAGCRPMGRIRIAMLVFTDMTADSRVDREASALARSGYDVTVVCLGRPGLPAEETRGGFRVVRVSRFGSTSWRRPLAKVRESRERSSSFLRTAREVEPRVVHCHDADTLPAGMRAARQAGALLVYDAHELFLDLVAAKGRGRVQTAYWRQVERRGVAGADLLLTVNEARARLLEERYGRPFEVVLNVPPVEPQVTTGRLRCELGLAEDVPLALYQGGLIPGRGLVRLVEAVSSVEDLHLAVQGDGSEAVPMRDRARVLGASHRVHLMGHRPPETLQEYACGADVGVVIYESTSLNNLYAAPNKLYGYLMAGLPIASSEFPGLREVVAGERVGALFDPGDPSSIASAIRSLIDHPEERREMARRARELAETRYNWDIESRKLLVLYERLGEEARR